MSPYEEQNLVFVCLVLTLNFHVYLSVLFKLNQNIEILECGISVFDQKLLLKELYFN